MSPKGLMYLAVKAAAASGPMAAQKIAPTIMPATRPIRIFAPRPSFFFSFIRVLSFRILSFLKTDPGELLDDIIVEMTENVKRF